MDLKATQSVSSAAVVFGVGAREGIGGALCARFAASGMHVYAVGRRLESLDPCVASIREEGGGATAIKADVTIQSEVQTVFSRIAEDGRVPEVVVFNASESNMPTRFFSMTPEFVEQMWRVCCLGGFMVGQEAIRHMLPQQRGTLLFTGATASLRGKPLFSAFAAAKAGLRAHAQAMAREFGPKGIHVAHVIIDGVVAGERAKQAGWGVGRAYVLTKGDSGTLQPDAIAEAYWQLHVQHRSTWTQELDLRPFKENF